MLLLGFGESVGDFLGSFYVRGVVAEKCGVLFSEVSAKAVFNRGGVVVVVWANARVEGDLVVDAYGKIGDVLFGVAYVHVVAFGDACSDTLGCEFE